MVVDFAIRKAPEYRLATSTLEGKWPGDRKLRSEFERVQAWASQKGLRTGKWFFMESGDEETPEAEWKWEVGIEIRGGTPRSGEGIELKTLPSSAVASVTFDPDQVSPRVIYHGMVDWLRSREKAGEYKEAGEYREVYEGNPWKSKQAWARTQVQVPVRRTKG